MVKEIIEAKKAYYNAIDTKANRLAKKLDSKDFIKELLVTISELYSAANTEKKSFPKGEYGYNQSVSNDFEFLIAKIFDHYSIQKNLNWRVFLRKQFTKKKKQLVPDIRIEKNNQTIAIFEIKVKGGWSQYLFSHVRRRKDQAKYDPKKSGKNPLKIIKEQRKRVANISDEFDISKRNIFFLLPSLDAVYKPRVQETNPDSYVKTFCRNMGIPSKNLILLSNNPKLNLSASIENQKLEPKDEFKEIIKGIK